MKKLLLVLMVLSITLFFSGLAQADLNSGLVAHYPFNGNAFDESGHGNDGTVNGATLTDDRFGNPNSAYSFDGSDDDISIEDSDSLDITGPITLSVWIKTSGTSTNSGVISKFESGHYDRNGYNINIRGDSFADFDINYEWENGIGTGVMSTTPVEDGEWHHIAAVYDGVRARIYIDGVFEAENSSDYTQGIGENDFKLRIGWDTSMSGNDRHFTGVIDDIRIYNRSLSDDEIQVLFAGEETCPDTGGGDYNEPCIASYNPVTRELYVPCVDYNSMMWEATVSDFTIVNVSPH